MLPTSLLTAAYNRQITAPSQSAEAYRRIKEKIITLELQPAGLIDEGRLCEELGIGRTPIREALLRLQQENLIIILPRRGTIIADLNSRDLQKFFEIRLQLEPYGIKLAVQRATQSDIAKMDDWSARAAVVMAGGNQHDLLTIDHEGHMLFAAATHNEFLEEMLERLLVPIRRLSYWFAAHYQLEPLPEKVEQLREIITCIKQRDSEGAESLIYDHISTYERELLAIL
jgi:GntR family transcriptional regulator, rspAB operon transcriptional repressor